MIEVIESGMMSTLQDGGRYGYQDKGVSVAGIMDPIAYKIGKILTGASEETPCIEMVYKGPTIKFHTAMEIALTGAIYKPRLNEVPVPMNETLYVQPGDILVCGVASEGIYGYLTFSKQVTLEKILNSYSTDLKSAIGGFKGRCLRAGDVLELVETGLNIYLPKRIAPIDQLSQAFEGNEVRYTKGAEANRFAPSKMSDGRIELEVTSICSRMGYRLKGKNLSPKGPGDIISEGVSLGTIQGTTSGEWIVMLADRQSVGGYARVGHVITADISKFINKRPGDKVYFKEISIEEAQNILRWMMKVIDTWASALPKRLVYETNRRQQYGVSIGDKHYRVQATLIEEA